MRWRVGDTAQRTQRVYQYPVEPVVLQNLPDAALLLPAHAAPARNLLAVECAPQIITLPGAAASLAAPGEPAFTRPTAGQAAWIYAMFQDTCGTPGDANRAGSSSAAAPTSSSSTSPPRAVTSSPSNSRRPSPATSGQPSLG